MNKIEVTERPVTVPAGLSVVLDKDQARRRAHLIESGDGKDTFVALKPLQFKVGETFECGGEVAKNGQIDFPAEKKASKKVAERPAEKKASKKEGE